MSLCTDHFSSDPTKWKAYGRCYDFKNPPSHPYINSLLFVETISLIFDFITSTLGVNFPESRITREDGEDFSFEIQV